MSTSDNVRVDFRYRKPDCGIENDVCFIRSALFYTVIEERKIRTNNDAKTPNVGLENLERVSWLDAVVEFDCCWIVLRLPTENFALGRNDRAGISPALSCSISEASDDVEFQLAGFGPELLFANQRIEFRKACQVCSLSRSFVEQFKRVIDVCACPLVIEIVGLGERLYRSNLQLRHSRSPLNRFSYARIKEVSETIPKEIEPKDGEHDHYTGKQDLVGTQFHKFATFAEIGAPARFRWLYA